MVVTQKKGRNVDETWLRAANIISGTQVRGQTDRREEREKERNRARKRERAGEEEGRHAKRVTGG